MKIIRKMVCPNGCNATFHTTGHVMQEWEVDAYGNFQDVVCDCLQTTRGADYENHWSCTKCGALGHAILVEKVDGEERPVPPRYLIVNDERGYTRLIGMGKTGAFDVVIDKIKVNGDKEAAKKNFEERYPQTKDNWI